MNEVLDGQELTLPTDENLPLEHVNVVCDVETVKRAQNGDKDAFSQLFMQTYRSMYYAAKEILSNDEDIYDALQIGYAKAYKYITRLSAPEKFYPWLHTTIKNASLDVRKETNAYASVEFSSDTPDTQDAHADAERRADLRQVLDKMDKARAQVLTLHYYDGLSSAEIARMLGEPASTVRSRLQAAKNEFRTLLEQSNIDKNFYGGSLTAMVITCLRSLVGTDILSAVVAQNMLDNVLDGKNGKLEKAAYRLVEKQRNRRILRVAGLLLAVCIGIAALTAVIVVSLTADRGWGSRPTPQSGGVATSTATTAPNGSASGIRPSGTTSIVTNPLTTSIVTGGGTTSIVTNAVTTSIVTEATTSTTSSRSSSSTLTTTTTTSAVTGAFVPDYRAGHANKFGNEMQNVFNNNGIIAKQDEWLYYFANNATYKVRTDGTGQQMIRNTSGYGLNVLGDWIYWCYGSYIYRAQTDGNNGQCLYEQGSNIRQLYVTENYAYFCDENGVHRLNLANNQVKTINTDIKNSYLRYVSEEKDVLIGLTDRTDSHGHEISQYSLSSPNVLQWDVQGDNAPNYPFDCLIHGDTLFYATPLRIYTADLRNTKPVGEELFRQQRQNAVNILHFSAYKGGTLTITNHNYSPRGTEFYFMDGTTAFIEDVTKPLYNFGDEYVYYITDGQLYRANGDCSNPVQLTK